jgi:hypothetical protein
MALQRKPRSEKEIALKKVLDAANDLINSCGTTLCQVGTTTGNFTSITNCSFVDVTIDVSETTVTEVEDFPGSDFLMQPGTTISGNFTSVGIINTFGVSAVDNLFNLIGSNKC